jgi:hypothetical protein
VLPSIAALAAPCYQLSQPRVYRVVGCHVVKWCNRSLAYVIADVIIAITADIIVDNRLFFVESPSNGNSIICPATLLSCVLLAYRIDFLTKKERD